MQMVESATNKLLHAPTTRLKAAAASSDGNDLVEAARHLFDLPDVAESPREEADNAAAAPDDAREGPLPH
jgi:hypothetical protein